MIAAFELLASDNAKGAFPLSRIRCRMDRAVEDGSHVDDAIGLRSSRVPTMQCATGFYGSESNSNDSPKEAA